jgi:NitT/TauT family transport system substrate-binding protein
MFARRLLVAAAAALTLSGAATACSSSSTPSATTTTSTPGSTALEKTHLVVAVPHIIQAAPLFLAIKEGYFKQVGLTVTPEFVTATTAAIPNLERGSVDVISGANYVNFFQLQASGAMSIKVLANAADCDAASNAVLALPSSGITGPTSLAGKTVAVQINPNIQTLTLNALLPSGVNVHYVPITFPSMIAAMEAHRVDAISEVEPFITEAKAKYGAHVVMSQCTGSVAGIPQAGDITTAAWVAKYPHTAAAFAQAIDKAQALAASTPSAVVNILPTYITGLTSAVAAHVDLGIFPTTMESAKLQQLSDLMHSAGMLKSPLTVTSLLYSTSG